MATAATDTMTLLVDLQKLPFHVPSLQTLTLVGHVLVTRPSTAKRVELGEGVSIDRGEFEPSTTSFFAIPSVPPIGKIKGIVLQASLPTETALRALAEYPNAVTLADASLVDRPALEAERNRLQRRLAAIDALLAPDDVGR